jgi:hypothetical protein
MRTREFHGRSEKTFSVVHRATGLVERDGLNRTQAEREAKKLGQDDYKVVESRA